MAKKSRPTCNTVFVSTTTELVKFVQPWKGEIFPRLFSDVEEDKVVIPYATKRNQTHGSAHAQIQIQSTTKI